MIENICEIAHKIHAVLGWVMRSATAAMAAHVWYDYANRYVLRSDHDARVELMFEKDEEKRANLWVKKDFVMDLLDGQIPFTLSPASKLYRTTGKTGVKPYGRHSALEGMMQLRKADLVCFALRDMKDLDLILAALLRIQRPAL